MGIDLGRIAERMMAAVLARRTRLPGFVNRVIDEVATNPDGLAGRLAARVLGGTGRNVPPPTEIPDAATRVYVGPTNYAGQGWHWARALEASSGSIGARNMAIDLPGGFAFPADSLVPVAVHTAAQHWQQAELAAVAEFTHVLFEAERPLFGPLFGRDVARELGEMQARGVSCAFMCHGTDIRSPRRHMARDPLSPYFDDRQTEFLQGEADANLALLRAHDLPVFVSTPDLLSDVSWAHWCPVVVDVERWKGGRPLLVGPKPVVAHLPSMGHVKGTHLIEPVVGAMHSAGRIEYRGMTGIRSSEMPTHIGSADIVLDQFRIGSYGVAAVEAMAAGRVVVGHVLPEVREHVRQTVSRELPIVEATPDTLEAVIVDLLEDADRVLALGDDGVAFASQVHAGPMSAAVLRREWIDRR